MRNKDRRDDPRLWSLDADRRTIVENEIAVGTVSGFSPYDLSVVVAAPQLHGAAARTLIALESLLTELRSRGLLADLEAREQAEAAATHLQLLLRHVRKEKETLEGTE